MLFYDFKSHNGSPVTAEITDAFFSKLQSDFGITEYGTGFVFHKEIDVPPAACMIDDEAYASNPEIIKYIISEYSKKKISKLSNSSLEELQIDVIFCKHISNAEFNKIYLQTLGDNQIYCEETLWVNMTDVEKTSKMMDYFNRIETAGNELTIIDAYLAPKNEEDDYFDFLTKILNATKASKITVYTKTSKNDLERIQGDLDMPLTVVNTSHFHDRFWLTPKKGFLTGTSFNGIGNRFSVIYELTEDDVSAIMSELATISSSS